MAGVSQDTSQADRRLLVVSYWYPPAVGAAAERLFGFARYLPEHGWAVEVITARRDQRPPAEKGVTVHEISDPLAGGEQVFADYDPRVKSARMRGWLRELVFPDRFAFWQRGALAFAKQLANREPPTAILVSFPPASAVMVALRLHRRTEIPLVLDLRDRWFGPGGYEPALPITRWRHARLERAAVSAASVIVTVSQAMADAVAAEQGRDPRRFVVIPNGFDDAGASSPAAPPGRSALKEPSAALTIAHVGTVITRNRPDLFFESITKLRDRGSLENVVFRFVGNLSRAYLDAAGLGSVVQTTGLVSRQEAHREMRAASALLLLTGEYVGTWGYNAKVFEYIRTGRPILCLEERPGSNDRGLLERFAGERTFFARLDNAQSLAQALAVLRRHLACQPKAPQVSNEAFAAYGRRQLTARLAQALADVVRR